jgi:hypothetical protein
VDDDGMSCTLSFNRSPFFCIVPWTSVYAMVGEDSRGMVWPADVPPEVERDSRAREAEQAAKKPAAERPLAVVKPAATPAPRGRKTAPRAADAGTVAKKPRSKKPRPPAAAEGRTRALQAIPDGAKAGSPVPAPTPAAPPPAATTATGAKGPTRPKPKREIPPYLRVVK